MDVSDIVAAQAAQQSSIDVEKNIPVEIDAGLLTVVDPNPIDPELYTADKEGYLAETAREGVQLLLNSLFSLPTSSTPEGPLAQLPPPTTLLPRSKPLPVPKPQTKWEKFASVKGINKTRKDKKVWDEERQEWVDRWGRDGKNREKEEQWIHEVPDNAPDDYSPATAARNERKQRVAKNEAQRKANLARAEKSERKGTIDKTLMQTKTSTASMGKFDKKLTGEPKLKGVKRKFAPNEQSVSSETRSSLALISKLDGSAAHAGKRARIGREDAVEGTEGVVNARKAIRFASKGRGAAALGRESGGAGRGRGRGGRGGGRGGKR